MANIQIYNLDTILQEANPTPNNLNTNGTWSVNNDASTTCNCGTITVGISNQPVAGNYLFIDDNCFDAIVASGTPCDITLTYTVEDVCTTISIHTLTLNPATCPNNITMTSNNPTDIAMLRLERLVYNGNTPTNYVYKVVDNTNGDATCESTGLFFVGETDGTFTVEQLALSGGCGYNPTLNPNQILIVLDDTNTYEDFDVPVGNYAAFICYCGDCSASACELYDCCGQTQSIDIVLRTLCDGGTGCTSILRNYDGANFANGSTTNFVVKLPFKVQAEVEKCVKFRINADSALADTVQLKVLDDNDIYQEIDINLSDVSQLGFTSTAITDLVFRASTMQLFPYQPYITIPNPKIEDGKYIFELTITPSTSTGITNWSLTLSCCDCLAECPPKEYFCIESIKALTLSPSTLCKQFEVKYKLGNYLLQSDLGNYVEGSSCDNGETCAMGRTTVQNIAAMFNFPNSTINGLKNSFKSLDSVPTRNTSCTIPPSGIYDYGNTITYAPDKITIIFGNTADCAAISLDIQGYALDYDNKFLVLPTLIDICDDSGVQLAPTFRIPLVQNSGTNVYKASFTFDCNINQMEVTFLDITNNVPANIYNIPANTCFHSIENPNMSSNIIYQNSTDVLFYPTNSITYSNVFTSSGESLFIEEIITKDIVITHGNNNYYFICPAFSNTIAIKLLGNETAMVGGILQYTNWIAYSPDVITNNGTYDCLTIFQHGTAVNHNIGDEYTVDYTPLPDLSAVLNKAIITVDTKVLDGITNECYSPTI